MYDFKKSVKEIALQNNMTLAELAEKMGISRQTLYNNININSPRVGTIRKIAETLGCDYEIRFVPKKK